MKPDMGDARKQDRVRELLGLAEAPDRDLRQDLAAAAPRSAARSPSASSRTPAAIAFTVTPKAAASRAREKVREASAPLEAA